MSKKKQIAAKAQDYKVRITNFLRWHWQPVVSGCAIFIAVCALFSSINQARLSDKHDRLSVRPALAFIAVNVAENEPASIQRHIKNNGLGPAFVKKFQVFYDGQMIEENSCSRALKILVKGQKEFSEKTASMFGCLKKGDVLARDESRPLIAVNLPKASFTEKNAELNNLADRFGFVVKYESAYRDVYTATVGDVGEKQP